MNEPLIAKLWDLLTENGSTRVLSDGTMFYSDPGSDHIDVYDPRLGTYRLVIEKSSDAEGCFV